MIRVKAFKEERTGEAPKWKSAEEFLNEIGRDNIISCAAYPTGVDHNLVFVYKEKKRRRKSS